MRAFARPIVAHRRCHNRPACIRAPVRAQPAEIISTYTSTAKKDCRAVRAPKAEPDDGFSAHLSRAWAISSSSTPRATCARWSRSGGRAAAAQKEPAAQAWFGPFSSTTTTIEWRHPKDGAPFAIIQRWHLADNDDTGPDHRPRTKQMLVVTRLPPGAVCHVAYVDVKANPNANELARQAADKARDFNCGKDKVRVEGASGRARWSWRCRGKAAIAPSRLAARCEPSSRARGSFSIASASLRQVRHACGRAGGRSSASQSRAPSTMTGRCPRSLPAAPMARGPSPLADAARQARRTPDPSPHAVPAA